MKVRGWEWWLTFTLSDAYETNPPFFTLAVHFISLCRVRHLTNGLLALFLPSPEICSILSISSWNFTPWTGHTRLSSWARLTNHGCLSLLSHCLCLLHNVIGHFPVVSEVPAVFSHNIDCRAVKHAASWLEWGPLTKRHRIVTCLLRHIAALSDNNVSSKWTCTRAYSCQVTVYGELHNHAVCLVTMEAQERNTAA